MKLYSDRLTSEIRTTLTANKASEHDIWRVPRPSNESVSMQYATQWNYFFHKSETAHHTVGADQRGLKQRVIDWVLLAFHYMSPNCATDCEKRNAEGRCIISTVGSSSWLCACSHQPVTEGSCHKHVLCMLFILFTIMLTFRPRKCLMTLNRERNEARPFT